MPEFDPSQPFEVVPDSAPEFDPSKPFDVVPEASAAPQDSSWSRAVTGIPEEAWRTTKEHAGALWENVKGAFPQIEELSTGQNQPPESVFNVPSRFGKFATAAGEAAMLPLAPFIGAGKSLLGRPLAHAIQKTGETIAPAKPEGSQSYQDILGRTVTPPPVGGAEEVYQQIRPDVETGLMTQMPAKTGAIKPSLTHAGTPELPPAAPENAPQFIKDRLAARTANIQQRASLSAAAEGTPLSNYEPAAVKYVKDFAQSETGKPAPYVVEEALENAHPEETLGELFPELTRRVVGLARSAGGPWVGKVLNFYRERGAETPERLKGYFNEAFGENENRFQLKQLREIERDKQASPLFDEFRRTSIPPTPELTGIEDALKASGAWRDAERMLRMRRIPRDQDGTPTTAFYQAAKESLDDKIAGALKLGDEGRSQLQAYTQLKHELINAVMNHPDPRIGDIWKRALSEYAGPSSLTSAEKMGANLLTENIHPDELQFLTAAWNPAQVRAARIGLRGYLEDLLNKPGPTEWQAIKKALGPDNQSKIRWILDDDRAADQLFRRLEQEARMHSADTAVRGNSVTSQSQSAKQLWEPQQGFLEEFSPSDIPTSATSLLSKGFTWAQNMMTKAAKERMRKFMDQSADILNATGSERDAIARYLFDVPESIGGPRGPVPPGPSGRLGGEEGGAPPAGPAPRGPAAPPAPPTEPPSVAPPTRGEGRSPDAQVGAAFQEIPNLRSVLKDMPKEDQATLGEFIQAIKGAAAKRQLSMENGQIFQGDRFNKKPFTGESETLGVLQKAYSELKKEQRGISTVYIGDLIERSGLSKEQIHDALSKAAREGVVSLHQSSVPEASLSSSRRDSALKIDNDTFHTFTFRRPVPKEDTAIVEHAWLEADEALNRAASVIPKLDEIKAKYPEIAEPLDRAIQGVTDALAQRGGGQSPPSWLQQNRQSAVDFATQTGLIKDVEQLARQGHTAKEISESLNGRLSVDDVRAVRDHLGIEAAGPQGGIGLGQMPSEPIRRSRMDASNASLDRRTQALIDAIERRIDQGWEPYQGEPVKPSRQAMNIGSPSSKEFSDKLHQIGYEAGDEPKMMSLLQDISKLSKDEVFDIVNDYINRPGGGTYRFKFDSKKDALEKIRTKWIERAESLSKDRIIGGHRTEPLRRRTTELGRPSQSAERPLRRRIKSEEPLPIGKGVEDKILNEGYERATNPAEMLGITEAYHGSPHNFNKFDVSKLGTGEGAQVYGKGLYFAEHPDVARSYVAAGPNSYASGILNNFKGNKQKAINYVKDRIEANLNERQVDTKAVENLKSALKELESDSVGNFYRVGIRANKDHMFDWDKPLSEQSQHVQKALRPFLDSITSKKQPNGTFEWYADGKLMSRGNDVAFSKEKEKIFRGGDLHALMSLYMAPEEIMRKAGIPGIKYLDEGSRPRIGTESSKFVKKYGTPEKALKIAQSRLARAPDEWHRNFYTDIVEELQQKKTSNFVIFNDKLIDIIDKNGKGVRRASGGPVLITGHARFGGRLPRASGGRVLASAIDRNPTEAQKEAGNYAKDHVSIHGLDITVENAKGHERSGVGGDGKRWSVKMPAHYGYIKGTVGKDKDHVDVYLGPHIKSPLVFVIDQRDAETKKFDEHKVFLGFASSTQVIKTYHRAFSDGKAHQRLGHLKKMTIDSFKDWLVNGDTTKPIAKDAA